jgi:hypothetical protein
VEASGVPLQRVADGPLQRAPDDGTVDSVRGKARFFTDFFDARNRPSPVGQLARPSFAATCVHCRRRLPENRGSPPVAGTPTPVLDFIFSCGREVVMITTK